jgi:hypothetical protein
MWFVVLFTISRLLIFKSATDPISIENSLFAEIWQVTDFRGLKLDRWLILVMETGSLNQPLPSNIRLGHKCLVINIPVLSTQSVNYTSLRFILSCQRLLMMEVFTNDCVIVSRTPYVPYYHMNAPMPFGHYLYWQAYHHFTV